MSAYFDCWLRVATDLFSQALAGEPQLVESTSSAMPENAFGFTATVSGDEQGQLVVLFEGSVLDAPLHGEGVDQKASWAELLGETFNAAAGDLLARSGRTVKVTGVVPYAGSTAGISPAAHAYELKEGERIWRVRVEDGLEERKSVAAASQATSAPQPPEPAPAPAPQQVQVPASGGGNSGFELLLDIELEAALRFGCREIPLGELLEMGPGDVVQLDRHVSDPVDLIVGDKIVARGEVVLVNGNFGLRVTEVAAPRKRLESIRCLF
ncbi:MAG: FliM/FliN family flagellar motor switch protein [Terracidiphilus sp.]|nr:FliM/FliN family flagellar motor switch protein [Terracidiphilus sp.]